MDATSLKGAKLALTADKLTPRAPPPGCKGLRIYTDSMTGEKLYKLTLWTQRGYVAIRAGEGEGDEESMVTTRGCIR